MDDLLPVDVSMMFLHADEAIADGIKEEHQHSQDKHQQSGRGPVGLAGDTPAIAISFDEPMNGVVADPEEDEKDRRIEDESFPDVVEDVVTLLMPKDEEDLVCRQFLN